MSLVSSFKEIMHEAVHDQKYGTLIFNIYKAILVFLLVVPLILIAGFIVGLANFTNPFKSSVELLGSIT